MFELPDKPTVDDVIYELSKELLGPITDSKNLRALGIAQEISIGFANKRKEFLHQVKSEIAFAEQIKGLKVRDCIADGEESTVNASSYGYHLLHEKLRQTNHGWGGYNGASDLLSLLKWISSKEPVSTTIVKARVKLATIVEKDMAPKELNVDDYISKYDYIWDIAYGDSDWRLKFQYWKENFTNSKAIFSSEHNTRFEEFEGQVRHKAAIVDDTSTNKKDREEAIKAIQDLWNEEYQKARQSIGQRSFLFTYNPLYVDKTQQNNKRKAPSSNKTIKTQSPQEKKSKPNNQRKSECEMCKLKNRRADTHKTEFCWLHKFDLFDPKVGVASIIERTKEEIEAMKKELRLKSNKNTTKYNYVEAYKAQLSHDDIEDNNPNKDQSMITPRTNGEEIIFLIDGGANVNIVRDQNLFTHKWRINTRLNSLGKTLTAELGGIVEVYAYSHDGTPILLRFDAIYIPATSNENVNIISTSQIVRRSLGCHCVGFCQNICGNINPIKEESLTATTTAGDTIRLHTTSINNTSRLEARRFGPKDSQVVDFSSRQLTDDALKERKTGEETPEKNYDSEEENDAYRTIPDAEEDDDEEQEVFTATILPETITPEETNVERTKIVPQQPFKKRSEINIRENISQKNQQDETNNNTENSSLLVENPTKEEEALFAKRMRDRDQAIEIHQKHGHMSYQKIIDSMAKCISTPTYEKISKPVLHELKNLRCDACNLTRNYQTRHPKSMTKQRAQYFGQCIKVDVLYGPNRFKTEFQKKFLRDLVFSQNGTDKKALPKTPIHEHVAKIGFGAPLAIVFVDEFSRWTTVLPLRTLREDEFISAFILFKDELTKMLHKYQKNAHRQIDGTAQKATNMSKFELFSFERRVQEILTDKQTGMFSSEKFQEFIRTFWTKCPDSKDEPFFTDAVIQYVPRDQHAHNGIAERKIRTLKEKAMVSLITAFGDKEPAGLDSFVYTYWYSAIRHAAMISNVMSVTVNGKAEVSPYTHITGKTFPMNQLYPFFARAEAVAHSKHDRNFTRRNLSERIKKPTQRALEATQNQAAKTLPYIHRDKVRYLYTDLTGHKIQPVVLNEDAWQINKHALTYFQNADHMKNIVLKTEVDIDARSFVNKNPKIKPTTEQLNKFASYTALLYLEGETRTTDMEDLEVFLGSEIPRSLSLPDPTPKQDEQHRGQKPGVDVSNDAENDEEESTTCSEVYYCPSVQSDEIDIIRHNHIEALLSTNVTLAHKKSGTLGRLKIKKLRKDGRSWDTLTNNDKVIKEHSAYAINCESNEFNPYGEDREFIKTPSKVHDSHASAPLWAYAVSRINSETGEQTKRRTLSECPKAEIEAAIKKEIDGIKEKEVMKHISFEEWKTMWPKGKAPKTLDTRVVLAVKENGEIKARLVAKGFRQRPGENYFQTFSPVVDRTSVHTILNIAAIKGLPLYSLDISQAFLQAPIDEDVFIKYNGEIYQLRKALYGTKQASRMWNKEITKALISYGMQQTRTDPCVFVKFEKSQPQVFVCVSTDDLLVASEKERWQNLAAYLSHDYQGRFKTSQLNIDEECTSFNGIEIKRENAHKYSINLNTYTNQLLLEYATAYKNITPKADIPIYGKQAYDRFTPTELTKCNAKEIKEYQSIVGQITWLSTNTRPDLVHFTASASRAAKDPNKGQLKILRRIIGYLKMTPNMSITFDGNGIDEIRIEAFTDAGESSTAFSATLPTRDQSHSKHTSGYVISMGSGALSWKSKLQPRVSSSICHGEYMAAELCLHEVKFIRDLLSDVGFPQTHTFMFIDNQASINLMLNNTSLKKHDRTTIHVLQESVDERVIIPIYIPSKLNVSDMFTKANAAKSGGQDQELIQMINGSKLNAVDYRKHIEKIVHNNYTKINKISEFPDIEGLLKHVSKSHKIGEKI